jgi:RHS repeat-associated protein
MVKREGASVTSAYAPTAITLVPSCSAGFTLNASQTTCLQNNPTPATISYVCNLALGLLQQTNCVLAVTQTVPATITGYSCAAGTVLAGNVCRRRIGFMWQTVGLATPSYACPAAPASAPAYTLSGSDCTTVITNLTPSTPIASCPGQQILLGSGIGAQCQAYNAATITSTCPANYTQQGGGCVSSAANINLQANTIRYFHTDHIGSVSVITDETGAVVERMAYDPWGKRRFTNGTADTNDTIVGLTTDRGYTEHEELDELGIIHMNGRIYDPTIGRFMSADPFIQAPYELQSHNRYAYVMNNPLLYTDPSGYSWWTKIRGIVITVVAAVVDGYGYGWVCGGSCATAVSYYNTAKTAYNLYQTYQNYGWEATWKGAARAYAASYISQRLFGGSGDIGEGQEYGWQHYAATAAAGCVSSVAGGGKCGQGAAAAVAGLYASHVIDDQGYEQTDANKAYHHAAVQVAGGLASQAVGGSFANGAQTASYGYLYNHENSRHAAFREAKMAAGLQANAVAEVTYEKIYDGNSIYKQQIFDKDGKPLLGRVYNYELNGKPVSILEHSQGHMQKNTDGKWVLQEKGHFNVRGSENPNIKPHYYFNGRVYDVVRYYWRTAGANGVYVPRSAQE